MKVERLVWKAILLTRTNLQGYRHEHVARTHFPGVKQNHHLLMQVVESETQQLWSEIK